MKSIYSNLKASLKGRSFLLKVYIAFGAFSFAVPWFKGKITSFEDFSAIVGKVLLVGGILLLFCFIEHAWKIKRKNKN